MTNTKSIIIENYNGHRENIIKKENMNSKEAENDNKLLKAHNVRSIRTTNNQSVEEYNNDDNDDDDDDDDNDDPDGSKKRRKLTCDERLKRNRERNRMHARKTRERKKKQSFALQQRISELQSESNQLRQIIDDRFTACALLGLSQQTNQAGENIPILSSASICKKPNFDFIDNSDNIHIENASPSTKSPTNKRVRRRGKYSPQERERIRRERNRMHAKRTRDKKKIFLEASEHIISEMESESRLLREYLVSAKLISVEYCTQSEQRAMQSKKELALLKAYSLQHDGNDDEQDEEDEEEEDQEQEQEVKYIMNQFENNEDGDDDHEGYHSGSDEKGSWGGSNDGSNQDSTNGETSGDGNNSGSDKGHRTFSSASSSSSSSLQYGNNLGTRDSSREGSTGSDNGNSGSGTGSDNGNNSGDENSDNGNGDNVSGEDSENNRSTTPQQFFTS